ncbi:MAG: pantoate--beta-alanine ligase [Phycisphaeraceae bacterium]|nr:pantoate--beta-alanine ligase [Phycisphaeraceae bacterium]
MWVAANIAEFEQHRRTMNEVAMVPTLGALHAGHLSLLERARTISDDVLVTIFVNPTQFGPGEDFREYPRRLDADLEMCASAQVTGVFCPEADEIYAPEVPSCEVDVPSLTGTLEGACRPGHFNGVCTVVLKLLLITRPDWLCMGAKDYQQLRVVQALVADLRLPIGIVACETVRDEDGLALSTRNDYLDPAQRRRACGLYKALNEARMLIDSAGETDPARIESSMEQVMRAHRIDVDYAAVRHRLTLAPLDIIDLQVTGGVTLLVAGRVDETRLIDNLEVMPA